MYEAFVSDILLVYLLTQGSKYATWKKFTKGVQRLQICNIKYQSANTQDKIKVFIYRKQKLACKYYEEKAVIIINNENASVGVANDY